MPIPVSCPSCAARLSVPDTAAGKQVKCPKCQTTVPLPAVGDDAGFEVVDSPPASVQPAKPIAAARPVKPIRVAEDDRPVRRPRDEDDDEDEDDRPRRKSVKRKEEKNFLSSPPVLIVGGLIGVGIAVLFLIWWQKGVQREFEREAAGPPVSKAGVRPLGPLTPATPPPGWQTFAPPGAGLAVSVPVALQPQNVPPQPGGTAQIWQVVHEQVVYQVNVITPDSPLGGPPPPGFYNDIFRDSGQRLGGQVRDLGPVSVSGHAGRQGHVTGGQPQAVIRIIPVPASNRVYILTVFSQGTLEPTDPAVSNFLDSLRIGS